VVALPGQEASADLLADLGTEACLVDPGADLLLAPVGLDGEAADGLLGEERAAETLAGLAVADPTADAAADEAATETRLELWVMGQ
jgi:hypothetical protein